MSANVSFKLYIRYYKLFWKIIAIKYIFEIKKKLIRNKIFELQNINLSALYYLNVIYLKYILKIKQLQIMYFLLHTKKNYNRCILYSITACNKFNCSLILMTKKLKVILSM